MSNFPDRLTHYFPDASWSMNGDDYAGLAWVGDGKPSEAELLALPWPPPPPVPREISDRQFGHALWKQGVITLAEAKAFVKTGTIPASMQALIDAMPVEIRNDVELMVSGATVFYRDHSFTLQIATAYGWTEAQVDDFWRFAAGL